MTAPLNKPVLRIPYGDQAEMVAKLTAVLARLGYDVTRRSDPQMTVGELARLAGRKTPGVSISLRRPSCPPFIATRGTTGRILKLQVSDRLLKHIRKTEIQ